ATLESESAASAGAHQQSRAAAPDRLAVTDTHDGGADGSDAVLATAATPPSSAASSAAATTTQDGAQGDPAARDREPGSRSSDADTSPSDAGLPGNGAIAQHLGAAPADAGAAMQAALWAGGSEARDARQVGSGPVEEAGEGRRSVFERRTPTRSSDTPQRSTASDEDDDGASLEATELANRLRGALAP